MVAVRDQQSCHQDDALSDVVQSQTDALNLEEALTEQNLEAISEIIDRAEDSVETKQRILDKALVLSPSWAPGCIDIIRFLLSRGADCNTCTVQDSGQSVWPVLHLVVVRSDIRCLELLLQCDDINKDSTSQCGQTALMIASSNAFLSGVQLLLDGGCDVNAVNPVTTSTALHWSFGLGVPFGINCYSSFETFEQFECFRCLVNAGADINSRDTLGFAPIHYAVRINHIDAVKMLISENCDLNVTGEFEPGTFDSGSILDGIPVTPFLLAVHYGHSSIAKLLIDSGCEFYQSAHVLAALDDKPDLKWLVDEFKIPRKLRDISRTYIRRLLRQAINKSVSRLPIPLLHKQNLLLNDVLESEI